MSWPPQHTSYETYADSSARQQLGLSVPPPLRRAPAGKQWEYGYASLDPGSERYASDSYGYAQPSGILPMRVASTAGWRYASAGSVQPGLRPQMQVGSQTWRQDYIDPVRPRGEWSNGLLACLGDAGTCLLANFVPCVVYSRNKTRLEHLQRTGVTHPTLGEACTASCAAYAGLCLLCSGWVLDAPLRSAIRSRYGVSSSPSSDCLATFLCPTCALEQESREITVEEARLYDASGSTATYADVDTPSCADVGCCCCGLVLNGAASDPWCWIW